MSVLCVLVRVVLPLTENEKNREGTEDVNGTEETVAPCSQVERSYVDHHKDNSLWSFNVY